MIQIFFSWNSYNMASIYPTTTKNRTKHLEKDRNMLKTKMSYSYKPHVKVEKSLFMISTFPFHFMRPFFFPTWNKLKFFIYPCHFPFFYPPRWNSENSVFTAHLYKWSTSLRSLFRLEKNVENVVSYTIRTKESVQSAAYYFAWAHHLHSNIFLSTTSLIAIVHSYISLSPYGFIPSFPLAAHRSILSIILPPFNLPTPFCARIRFTMCVSMLPNIDLHLKCRH